MRIKIRNGLVLDGTGKDAYQADVCIERDHICAIEPDSQMPADKILDAKGLIVCPGFIDVHTHSDAYILLEPNAPSKMHQGVTTEIVGNCGASCAPLYGESRMPADWTAHEYPGTWQTVADYRQLLEKVVPGPNIVLLVGHNTIRAGVMGYQPHPATPEEIRRMAKRLEQAMDEGARGLSTGLVYNPGRFAESNEVNELTKIVAAYNGIYTSHMRSESSKLLEAIDETLAYGLHTGARVQISHLKAYGKANWHLLEPAIERIHAAKTRGLEVFADRYPYTASCTDLDIIFPDWALAGGPDAIRTRLRDPQQKSRLLAELKQKETAYWQSITIGSTVHPDNQAFAGKPLWKVARTLAVHPAEAALLIAEKDELRTAAFFHGMDESNMLRVLAEPYVMIGSDASLRAPTGPLSHDWPHPRAYGTFPRFLRMSLDAKTVPLPEAIRKMTSLPAETFRLAQRGIIRKGFAADIVVFDPETIQDQSAFDRPHAIASGIKHVIVNGTLTLENSQLTNQRNGSFL
ncbi:MAG: N-acyl-D-amino-acid deacylase family protein [Kiritimatiellia bacterium]